MDPASQSNENSLNDSNQDLDESVYSLKMFQFERIRCKNLKTDNKYLTTSGGNMNYEVPSKRSGHRAVCDDENLWTWGGFCPTPGDQEESNPMLPELFRFNFATRKWCQMKTTGDMPSESVASHSAIKSKNLLIVMGGTGFPFGSGLSNKLYTFNLKTLVWTKYDLEGQLPLPLYGSSLVMIGNYLYYMCGTDAQQYCTNVYRIDIAKLESCKLFDSIELIQNSSYIETQHLMQQYPDDFLAGRYRQEAVVYNEKIYLLGGGKFDGDCFPLNKLPCFNTETNEWEFVETRPDLTTMEYPERRKFHSCFTIGNYIYVFGGICTVGNSVFNMRTKMVPNFVWRLDMRELRWQKLDIKIPVMTYFHGACEHNGQVFIHGGVKMVDREATRINHLYSIYLTVPKLSEMAWKSLQSTCPNMIKIDKRKLLDTGLPVNFVNKIN